MLLIACPWCGEREEPEFQYGGQAHVLTPEDSMSQPPPEWATYLFYRDNPSGPFAERWMHTMGCRRWFNVVRDTTNNVILAVYRVDEERPVTV